MTPDTTDLCFVPLGGCGEIGMNMNLYGHDDNWLMVDCGITFAAAADPIARSNKQVQMADPAFIVERREKLAGIVITHAHEDHIGALPWLWRKLQAPVYTSAYTAEVLRRKLIEHGLEGKVPVHVVADQQRLQIGSFSVEWIQQTHSVPEPFGLLIDTPVGRIFHTADWKLDATPVVGAGYDEARYRSLGQNHEDSSSPPVAAIVCDSTCATVPEHTPSEGDLYTGLKAVIEAQQGRVVIACFGSNIARLTTLARIADECDRHLGLLGRSLLNTVSAARSVGLWEHQQTLVDQEHLGYLPASNLLLVATGSQGEQRTGLDRLSRNSFRDLALEPGDTVIFSARKIPGNENDVDALIARLESMQVKVVTPDDTSELIHTSGHPSAAELKQMYEWVQPEICIPVHGEPEHLQAHGQLAREAGIDRQLCGRNGDLFFLSPNKGVRREAVSTGRLGIENGKLIRVE